MLMRDPREVVRRPAGLLGMTAVATFTVFAVSCGRGRLGSSGRRPGGARQQASLGERAACRDYPRWLSTAWPADGIGVSGSSLLAAVLFEATVAGTAALGLSGVGTTPEGELVPLAFPPVAITVR